MGEDVVSKYSGQLAELKINSKPLINLLTMMAEDFLRQAPAVVQVIEKHLNSVRQEHKLPALYLIDSIIKNVRKEYITLFTQNIVSTFCTIFEKADEKTRTLLWKLRGTWNDHFPQRKLYAIDLRCREIDPKWPLMSNPPTSVNIHVNPKFLNRNKTTTSTALMVTDGLLTQSSSAVPSTASLTAADPDMQAQLIIAKKRELIELQEKKIQLELLQMQTQENARRQKEVEATRQIDVAVKQERLLLGMAEAAKNRTEKIQQQLSSLHPNSKPSTTSTGPQPSSSPSVKTGSPSKYDSSSDRESHSSASSRAMKSHSETSVSSGDINPSKKSSKSSRDKDRDRKDRSKNDKNKEKDRQDSKEKESRHSRHRDKDRRAESKDKSRSHERSREPASTFVAKSSGEWKDYNEAKKMSPPKRYKKDSDDDIHEITKFDTKPFKRTPSPTPPIPKSPGSSSKVHENDCGQPTESLKSPSKSPSSSHGENSGRSSPLKRRHAKNSKSSHEKGRSKEKNNEKSSDSKNINNNDKPVISDPRLRKRLEEAAVDEGTVREEGKGPGRKAGNETEWKNYSERQKAVLRRSYRKNPGIEEAKEDSPTISVTIKTEVNPDASDMDLRFEGHMDVDLRPESDGSGSTEPPAKKSKPGKEHGTLDDLFGQQDVDLRAGSSWTQVKSEERSSAQDIKKTEDKQVIVDVNKLPRPQVPPSPADSIGSGSSISTCDPLGRPLVYSRLPNDPEERKRSLDTRSNSIDPVVRFRTENVDHIVQATGELSESSMKMVCIKAKDELDQGFLTSDQYIAVMKQVLKIHEATALRDVQMKGDSWQISNITPNPWVQEPGGERNIWTAAATGNQFGPTPAGPPIPGNFNRRLPGVNVPWDNSGATPWMAATGLPSGPPGPIGPNPFEEAIGMPMVDDFIPKANKKDLQMADQDVGHNIPIDKIQRQVRFYRDTTVVFMGIMNDVPKELTFQRDERPRQVLINGKPLELFLGESKKFDINRVAHTVRIGTPGRELCIDDRCYEAFFGGRPAKVYLDGRAHSFQLLPPSPQVAVGQVSRYDLCAGRVNLILDAVTTIPMYLDEKLQKIDIFGEPVVARFSNGFELVSLNGRPFPTNFGATRPFSITLPGAGKHFLRFSSISPETQRAIQLHGNGEWVDNRNQFGGRGGVMMRGGRGRGVNRGRGRDMPMDNRMLGPNPWAGELSIEPPSSQPNPLDLINNLFPTPSESQNNPLEQSYESEPSAPGDSGDMEDQKQPDSDRTQDNNLNVSDLVANLIKYGLLPTSAPTAATESNSPGEPAQEESAEEDKKKDNETNAKEDEPDKKEKVEPKPKPPIPPLPTIDLTFDDNLRERRQVAVDQILIGVQCSQCGLRFAPDQTLRYSQHLDWHFRQNRRDKANVRKALSRKWYYDLSDWIQFEEVEDLEERAASLFENQDAENENDAKSPSASLNPEDFTVLASSHQGAVCPQCGEEFESYFDEEREEWRLKNAKIDECDGVQKVYHPICHQDYLRSLVDVEESTVEESILKAEPDPVSETNEEAEEDENLPKSSELDEDDEVLIIKEGKKEVVVMEIDIDDDDVKNDNHTVNVKDDENTENKTDDINTVENTENINVETDSVCIGNNSTSLGINDDARNSFDQSPILIDEDSTFLPGLNSDSNGGVFGFALGTTGSQPGIREELDDDDRKIVYEPMKFDIPAIIKLEPLDKDEKIEDLQEDGFMQNLQPFLTSSGEDVPMNIDLTEEDSSDAVDSGARLVTQIRTSIDGNLQHEETSAVPFIPTSKIRINISGVDTAPLGSPKEKVASPKPIPSIGGDSESTEGQSGLVKDDGGSTNSNIVSNNPEMNKDNNPDEPVLTEEMKRLKPRLVGRKLTNCPPKFKGTEESGLCVIC